MTTSPTGRAPAALLCLFGALASGCFASPMKGAGAWSVAHGGLTGRQKAGDDARRAARMLGASGGVRFVLETDGREEALSTEIFGPAVPEATFEKWSGGWTATAAPLPRSPSEIAGKTAPLAARGEAQSASPEEAIARAESDAIARLVHDALARTPIASEGRITGRVLPMKRTVEIAGRRAVVALDAVVVVDEMAQLEVGGRCRLALGQNGCRWANDDAERVNERLRRARDLCRGRAEAMVKMTMKLLAAGQRKDARRFCEEARTAAETLGGEPIDEAPPAPLSTPARDPRIAPAPDTRPRALAPTPAAPRSCRDGAVLVPTGDSVTAPFCMDRTEATDVTGRTPLAGVSYVEAESACRKRGGRLPTEAEWLLAAAGPEHRAYPWGDAPPDCEHANTVECGGAPQRVDALPKGATPLGIVDLAGNLREWIASPQASDERPPNLRGGGWSTPASETALGTAAQPAPGLHHRDASVGFRCVYAVTPAP